MLVGTPTEACELCKWIKVQMQRFVCRKVLFDIHLGRFESVSIIGRRPSLCFEPELLKSVPYPTSYVEPR